MKKNKRLKRIINIIILCMLVLDWSNPVLFADENTLTQPLLTNDTPSFPTDLANLIPVTPSSESEITNTKTAEEIGNSEITPEQTPDSNNIELPSGEVTVDGGDDVTQTGDIENPSTGEVLSGETTVSTGNTGNQIFVIDADALNQVTIVPLIDHETVVDTLKLVAPTIKSLYDEQGRFDPVTLQSYVTAGGAPAITYCSMIARNNIAGLLSISPTDSSLAWGDATTLIQTMISEGRGYSVSRYDLEKTLLSIYTSSKATIFDIYSYNGDLTEGDRAKGHRITIVLGTDNMLYVLDPIRTHIAEPVLLSKYIQYFLEGDVVYVNRQAYSPYGLINQGLEQDIDISITGISVSIPSGTVIDPVGQTGVTIETIVQEFVVQQNQFLYSNGDAFVVKTDIHKNTNPFMPLIPIVDVVTGSTTGTITGDIIEDIPIFTGSSMTGESYMSGDTIEIIELPDLLQETPLIPVDAPILVQEDIQNTGNELPVDNGNPIVEDLAVGQNSGNIIMPSSLVENLVEATVLVPLDEIVETNYSLQIELPFTELLGSDISTPILDSAVIEEHTEVEEYIDVTENVQNIVDTHSTELFPTLFDSPGVDVSDINNVVDIDAMSEYEQITLDKAVAPIEPIIIGAYKIGNLNSHLIFSKPVKVEIAVTQPEGEEVTILVKHEGYTDYSVQGLAVDSSVTCSGGISSSENNIAYVKGGKVTFYTCGASDFLATVSAGTATIVYPVSGSTIYNIQPMFLGTGTNTGAIITVSYSGGAVIGTASVQGGNWGFFANAPLSEGNHLICISGGGCTSFTISAFVETKGDIDHTYTGTFSNGAVSALSLLSNDNILIGGAFTTFNGISKLDLAVTNNTGGLNNQFTGSFSNGTILNSLVMLDGDVILGGTFTTFNGITRNRLVRTTSTGAIDITFTGSFANNTINSIVAQPDGKILVGGQFTTMNGVTRNRLARLTSTGALDTTFTGAFANNTINIIKLQPDGKVLVGGLFTTMNGVTRNRLARLTITGALDTTFTGIFATSGINDMSIRPDGDIIICGGFTGFNGISRNRLARVTITGALDATFTGTFANSDVTNVTTQPNEEIIAGGTFTTMNGTTKNYVARLTITGALDHTFTGTFANNAVSNAVLQPDGSLILGGSFTTFNGISKNRLVRLKPTLPVVVINTPMSGSRMVESRPLMQGTGNIDGTIVSVWYSGGALIGTAKVDQGMRGFFPSDTLLPGQQTLCATAQNMQGTSCVSVLVSAFTESNGVLDYTFSGAFANNTLHTIGNTLDDEYFAGGQFTTFNGIARNRGVSFTTTGFIDPTFTGTFANNTILTNINRFNGSIIIGGLFTGFNGVTRNRIARVTNTGALDPTFTGSFATTGVFSLMPIQDGGILVGGAFTGFNGVVRNRLTLLTTTGATDPTFTGTFANNDIYSTALQPDGNIIVAGSFTTFNGITRNRLARVTTTGVLDTTFTGSFANGDINVISLQPDGKVLVAGSFTTFNGVTRNRLARVTSTGALDTTFTGSFSNSEINTLLAQPDGKVLLGGVFTTINGVSRNYIARVTTTGALDRAFSGTFANSGINNMIFDSSGDLLIGGGFTTFNGVARNRLARLTVFTPGIVNVLSPLGLEFSSSGSSSFAAQTMQQTFPGAANYFTVSDAKSQDSGYNTTLQLSGNLTTGSNSISAANVLFRASGGINLISGSPNPRVDLDAATAGFQSLNTARSFIARDPAPNFNTIGEYGANIELRVDIPAAQAPGDYAGTIVYTLIEN